MGLEFEETYEDEATENTRHKKLVIGALGSWGRRVRGVSLLIKNEKIKKSNTNANWFKEIEIAFL